MTNSKTNLGKNVSLNNVLLIQGKSSGLSHLTSGIISPSSIDKQSDLIVPAKGMKVLCDNLDSSNKYYASFNGLTHGGLGTTIPDKSEVKILIKDFITKKVIAQSKSYVLNTDCSTI